MMNFFAYARSNSRPVLAGGLALAAGALAFAGPLAAQTHGKKISNDLSQCSAGKGPAVLVKLSGLKSADGNLFVRTYNARKGEWLKSKRYISRVDTKPRRGTMTVCVPVPAAGNYAIAVQHDANGNSSKDLSVDGVGMSRNPKIGTFLGIPRLPSVDKTQFTAGTGVTSVAIQIRYRD